MGELTVVANQGDARMRARLAKGTLNALGAHEISATGEYVVGCNADLPTIDITIGGIEYSIDANNLVLPDGPICILLMLGMDLHPEGIDWILGDVFMRQYVGDEEGPPRNRDRNRHLMCRRIT